MFAAGTAGVGLVLYLQLNLLLVVGFLVLALAGVLLEAGCNMKFLCYSDAAA